MPIRKRGEHWHGQNCPRTPRAVSFGVKVRHWFGGSFRLGKPLRVIEKGALAPLFLLLILVPL